jgi:hypothetical protein
MPLLSYSVADFLPFTKILSAEVNSKFNDIKTLLNTTKLDTTNIQQYGVARDRLAAGTANHVIINDGSGYVSSEAQLATTRGGLGFNPSISLSTAGQAVKVNQAGTGFELGSVATGLGLEALEQIATLEQYGDVVPTPDNSIVSGLSVAPVSAGISGVLMKDYTASAATIDIAHSPRFLNDSDKDMDTTTNWLVQGAGTNLTNSGTPIIGSAALAFDKDNSATSARIRYDRGSVNLFINANTDAWMNVYLPSVTDVSSVGIRMDIDGTNYQEFTASTKFDGSALSVGNNLINIDLSTGGSAGGTGWNSSLGARYCHVVVNTGSAGTTLTGIEVDALMFSLKNPTRYFAVGDELSVFNTTNKESMVIASSNTRVAGRITLGTALTNSYAGGSAGTAGVVKKQTLSITGDNTATMDNTLSGNAAKTQELRFSTYFRESQTSIQADGFVALATPQAYEITAVGGSSIDVSDSSNTIANLLTGAVVDVFRTIWNENRRSLIHRGSITLTGNATHSSGTSVLSGTVPAGTAIGDIAIKRHISSFASMQAVAANDSFTAMTLKTTPNGVIASDLGINYPSADKVWGHWRLGDRTDGEAVKNRQGIAVAFTKAGTMNLQDSFANGSYGASGFDAVSNWITMSNTDSEAVSGDSADCTSLSCSIWFIPSGFTGASRAIIGRWAGNNGWLMYAASGANEVYVYVDASATFLGPFTFTPNALNHIVLTLEEGVEAKLYGNGALVDTDVTAFTVTDPGANLQIGTVSSGSSPATGIKVAEAAIWRNHKLSANQVSQIYNGGSFRPLGFSPGVTYRYNISGLTGQKLVFKASLNRDTTAVTPYITKVGIIKV